MAFSFSSLISGVESVAHTFLGYVGRTLGIIGKYEPQVADVLSHSMNYIEPLAVDVVAAEFGGPAGAVVDVAAKNLLTSATALKSLIYDWQNSPGILAKLRALAADAASLVALGHIKNQASIDKINRIASEATAAADVAEKALPAPVASVPQPATPQA